MIDFVILCVLLVVSAFLLLLGGTLIVLLGTILLPVAFIAMLVIWVIEWNGVNHFRRRFGKLQLPIVILRENNTGNLVRLVGVVHIAESACWKNLTEIIDQYPHATVLYESVTKVTEEEKLLFTENELAVWKQFAKLGPAMNQMGMLMGLTFQKGGLAYPESWIRTDMTGFDFTRNYAAAAKDEKPFEFPEFPEEAKPLMYWMLRTGLAHMPILTLFTNKRKRSKARQLVIIDMRNIIGCDAIAEYGDKGDVISVWGGGHIPGMVHFLLQMNYEVIATDWHDVIDGNKYSLWGAIRDTLKATKENSKNKAELKKPPTD